MERVEKFREVRKQIKDTLEAEDNREFAFVILRDLVLDMNDSHADFFEFIETTINKKVEDNMKESPIQIISSNMRYELKRLVSHLIDKL